MFLQLKNLAKRFGDTVVLNDFSLTLEEGEILALLGPSGSGKTTALRLLAGFETPDQGTIQVAGQDITSLAPARRGVGMVFQHYALFPHMSVYENITFGLASLGWMAQRQAERAREVLELVDLSGFEGRPVSGISGGQQQRVAVARALAPEPRVLLLDEPLSNLDPTLRERTRHELRQAVRHVGITTILVTHEQDEAFYLGDRVAVLHRGQLEQVGLPETLYHEPQSRFVATFVGRANILEGTFVDDKNGRGQVRLKEGDSPLWPGHSTSAFREGEEVQLIVRPEALRILAQPDRNSLPGSVLERRFTGPLTYYSIALDGGGKVEVIGSAEVESRAGTEKRVFVDLNRDLPLPPVFRPEPKV